MSAFNDNYKLKLTRKKDQFGQREPLKRSKPEQILKSSFSIIEESVSNGQYCINQEPQHQLKQNTERGTRILL